MTALVAVPPGGIAASEVFRFDASDGVNLRGAVWHASEPRGHVVFLNGRAESVEKVSVYAAALTRRGYSVASLDWRGQGLSSRLATRRAVGHVDDFERYQRDLAGFLEAPLVARLPGKRIVFGHSMGGAIALRWLSRGTHGASAVVLSAPMLGIALSPSLRRAARLIAGSAARLGLGRRWPPARAFRKPYAFNDFEGNVLTQDREMWAWMGDVLRTEPRLIVAGPSLGWIAAALRETIALTRLQPPDLPMLIVAGSKETVVDLAAIRLAVPRYGASLAVIDGARHEPLIEAQELRARAWSAIDDFLGKAGA